MFCGWRSPSIAHGTGQADLGAHSSFRGTQGEAPRERSLSFTRLQIPIRLDWRPFPGYVKGSDTQGDLYPICLRSTRQQQTWPICIAGTIVKTKKHLGFLFKGKKNPLATKAIGLLSSGLLENKLNFSPQRAKFGWRRFAPRLIYHQ